MNAPVLADAGSGSEVIACYADALSELASRISDEDLRAVVLRLVACRGKLVTVGVGKSGLVAQRTAALFNSVGLPSQFLNPLDALHGDLGALKSDDIVLVVSNSGSTPELIAVAPYLKMRASCVVAIVSSSSSDIARWCDQMIVHGKIEEVDPLRLVPTASTLAASAVGDALVIMWMRAKQVSTDLFASNHPAGVLGRRINLRVRDVMLERSLCPPVSPTDGLVEVLRRMSSGGAGAVWVEDQGGRLVGIVTDGDVRRSLQTHRDQSWMELCSRDVMTADPIVIGSDELAVRAMEIMERNRRKPVSVLPVVSDLSVVGLVRLHDLVQAGLS